MNKPVDIKAAKERLERKKHSALVLENFDKLVHAEKREIQERRAEIERIARNKL